MAGNRAKGKRYDDEPKLNYKKVQNSQYMLEIWT